MKSKLFLHALAVVMILPVVICPASEPNQPPAPIYGGLKPLPVLQECENGFCPAPARAYSSVTEVSYAKPVVVEELIGGLPVLQETVVYVAREEPITTGSAKSLVSVEVAPDEEVVVRKKVGWKYNTSRTVQRTSSFGTRSVQYRTSTSSYGTRVVNYGNCTGGLVSVSSGDPYFEDRMHLVNTHGYSWNQVNMMSYSQLQDAHNRAHGWGVRRRRVNTGYLFNGPIATSWRNFRRW